VITGIGVDIDKAKQNAIRNAVEQVIGTYVFFPPFSNPL
jgi:hypothetical protein